MSSVLFDTPGPRARARHRVYSGVFVLLLAGLAALVGWKLYREEVLTPQVFNDAFQNDSVTFLLEGLVYGTLKAAGMAIVLSLLLGMVLAVGRLSAHWWFRWPAAAVVELFRAIPLVLLIVFLFFGVGLPALWALVVSLTLYNGSVLAEAFRAGVNAVAIGQGEAAYSLGMRKTQVMRLILLPQAIRFMLPVIISQCVIVLKDTSLGALIAYEELLRYARLVAGSVPDGTIVVYGTAALVYILLNYALSKLAEHVERRLARRGVAPDKPLRAPDLGEASGRRA